MKTAHFFYSSNGLSELLEKLEFSKGTEWIKSEGVRLSFINHYEVQIEDDNIFGDTLRYKQERRLGFVSEAADDGKSSNTNFGSKPSLQN